MLLVAPALWTTRAAQRVTSAGISGTASQVRCHHGTLSCAGARRAALMRQSVMQTICKGSARAPARQLDLSIVATCTSSLTAAAAVLVRIHRSTDQHGAAAECINYARVHVDICIEATSRWHVYLEKPTSTPPLSCIDNVDNSVFDFMLNIYCLDRL